MIAKMNTNVAKAYDIILQKIFSFELEPGALVSDNQLAKELGMSRAPVREAVLILTMAGLIQNLEGKSVVSSISITDIIDILHVRNALETESLLIIADNGWLTAAQEEELKKIHGELLEANSQGDMSEQYFKDDLFHSTLSGYSNSPRISNFLNQMKLQMQRARWLNLAIPERQDVSAHEHTNLLNAILNKDLDVSINCLKQHLQNSELSFRHILSDKQTQQLAKAITNFFSP